MSSYTVAVISSTLNAHTFNILFSCLMCLCSDGVCLCFVCRLSREELCESLCYGCQRVVRDMVSALTS